MAYYDETHLKRLEEIKKLKMDMRLPVSFIKKQLQKLEKTSAGSNKVAAGGSNEILSQLRAEMADEEDWPREKVKQMYHHLTQPLIIEVQKACDQGLIRQIDPDLLAYALTGLIEIMSFRTTLDKKYVYDDIIEFIDDIIINRLIPG